jgi:hypothetical protein
MTNLDPDQPREDHGVGWITLTDDVTMHSAWLTAHAPDLFTTWQQAQTAQQRMQTARMIQHAAANPADPNSDYRSVRIEWAETTRYEADVYISPYATDAELWAAITALPDALKRTLDVTDDDGNILSVIDLDGDGRPSVLERAISAGNVVASGTDWIAANSSGGPETVWANLAAGIDERLTHGPDWPGLASALDRAAASGYDVKTKLPFLAAAHGDLSDRHPALDLQYRLMADCDAALPAADADASTRSTDQTGSVQRPPDLSPPATPPQPAPGR